MLVKRSLHFGRLIASLSLIKCQAVNRNRIICLFSVAHISELKIVKCLVLCSDRRFEIVALLRPGFLNPNFT